MTIFALGHGRKKGATYGSLLLKTGQTTSYATGDDGDLELGVAKSYTILTAGQYALTTAITLNGKTDNHSNNCVLDNNTGLMWSRYASASVGPNSNGTLPWTVNAGGEGIFEYCAAANAASLGGYTDWRVPNPVEISSLLNWGAGGVDTTAFPTSFGKDVWTSGTNRLSPTQGISAYMLGPSIGTVNKTTAYTVVLVRSA